MTATRRPSLALHRMRRWSAWVLAWFTVTLAVGVMAPSMDPRGLAALCSASPSNAFAGWNADSPTDDGTPAGLASHDGVCPLCASPATLPPAATPTVAPYVALAAHPVPPGDDRQPASHTTRPALARGPPATAQG